MEQKRNCLSEVEVEGDSSVVSYPPFQSLSSLLLSSSSFERKRFDPQRSVYVELEGATGLGVALSSQRDC